MEAQNLEVYHPPALRITNSVTVTLTEKNYILWKSQFEAFLNGQGLLGYVTGQTLQPAASLTVTGLDGSATQTPNPESTKWFQTDQVVKSWLLGSFSEDILSLVVDCQTPTRSGFHLLVTTTTPRLLGCLNFRESFRRSPNLLNRWLSIFRRLSLCALSSFLLVVRFPNV